MKKESLIADLKKYYTDKHNGVEVGKIADIVTANGAKYEGGRYIVLDGEKTRLDTFCRANGVETYNSYSKTAAKGDGETKQPKPATAKKSARKGRKTSAPAQHFNALVLSVIRRETSDGETSKVATAAETARAAVTALNAVIQSGIYTAARAYIVPALTAARADYNRAAAAADTLNRAAETAARFVDWQNHTTASETARAAYKIQSEILAAISDETARAAAVSALKTAGNYTDAPAPFARLVCDGLQVATAADAVTAETAATFAAADRDRAAADLAETLSDAVYCNNLAARLETTAADLATLFNVTAAPTVAETAAKVAKVATAKPTAKRARKTA